MILQPTSLVPVAIGLALIVFVIVRQILARPLNTLMLLGLPLLLVVFGAQNLAQQSGIAGSDAALLALNGALAIGLGALRALSMRVWVRDDGTAMVKGTIVTLALWLLSVAARVAMSVATGAVGVVGTVGAGALTGHAAPNTGELLLVLG